MAGVTGGIVEYFAPGDRFTLQVDEAAGVVGGNVLTLTADREVGICGVADRPIGIALHTAADNTMVTVVTEGVWPLVAAAAVTAGDTVVVADAGKVTPDTTTPDASLLVGIALEGIAQDAAGPVKLRLS